MPSLHAEEAQVADAGKRGRQLGLGIGRNKPAAAAQTSL